MWSLGLRACVFVQLIIKKWEEREQQTTTRGTKRGRNVSGIKKAFCVVVFCVTAAAVAQRDTVSPAFSAAAAALMPLSMWFDRLSVNTGHVVTRLCPSLLVKSQQQTTVLHLQTAVQVEPVFKQRAMRIIKEV